MSVSSPSASSPSASTPSAAVLSTTAIGAAERIALVGHPNSGKTALFNRLTGSRQKVANYAGVTVERKEGRLVTPGGRALRVLDLPGAYSLRPKTADEAITRAVCLGEIPGEAPPDLLVCVLDATNLRLDLRIALEVKRLGRPMVVALNMMDDAHRRGIAIDRVALQGALGVPVVETVAIRRGGAQELLAQLDAPALAMPVGAVPDDLHAEVRRLLDLAVAHPDGHGGLDEAIDRVVLHPVAGLALLAATLFLMFQAVYSWAAPFADAIEAAVGVLGTAVAGALHEGPLKSLLVDGLIAGLGSVLVFLPQILVLFLFILALEQSGYLPRAAFLLDAPMRRVGLSGRSFIPLLSSFACAIPGVMAARTIQHPGDRIATILIAPLMTCSARLPVYALLIAAFIPARTVAGLFNLQGLVLFGLYVAGVASAMAVAWVLKRWRDWRAPDTEHPLLLELPAYRIPHPRDLALGLLERARIFLRRVGTVILTLMVLLWALSSWPAPPPGATEPAIYYSVAGWIGRALEVVLAPIGFNWQIGIALVPGLAAREVMVAALGTVYALAGAGGDASQQLLPVLAAQWAPATGFALLAWYVFAPQCLPTLAAIRQETGSWRIAGLAAAYLLALAYLAAFLTYRLASALA